MSVVNSYMAPSTCCGFILLTTSLIKWIVRSAGYLGKTYWKKTSLVPVSDLVDIPTTMPYPVTTFRYTSHDNHKKNCCMNPGLRTSHQVLTVSTPSTVHSYITMSMTYKSLVPKRQVFERIVFRTTNRKLIIHSSC